MTEPRKGSFAYIAQKIRSDAKGTTFGSDFERLCIFFLKNDPLYADTFKRVLLFDHWSRRWGRQTGIDIVAETKAGEIWAVQAKDYGGRPPNKRDIDSFLSDSSRKMFSYRLLITTNEAIGPNAEKLMRAVGAEAQDTPVGYITRETLEASPITWPTTIHSGPKHTKPRPLPRRAHQTKAVNAVLRGFKSHDRGRLIMACGTGKTHTALLISEKLKSKRVLLLVPSLGLVKQTINAWKQHRTVDFDHLLVCSDQTVDPSSRDPSIQRTADLGVPVSTSSTDIRRFLKRVTRRKQVVISTYQSLERIVEAQRLRRIPEFDLVIADEAHRTATPSDSHYSLILSNKHVRASKRLFMTATPRYVSGRVKTRAENLDHNVVSMDDEALYGPEFHRFDFSEAIRLGQLSDYRFVIVGVVDEETKRLIDAEKIVKAKGIAKTDTYTLAKILGLLRTVNKYKLRKIISFHQTVSRAKHFVNPDGVDSLPVVNNVLPKRLGARQLLWAGHVNGQMTTSTRATTLQCLEELDNTCVGLISNVACLGEGIDLPDLDSVAFIDPKQSEVDIIQAVGRAIRKPHGRKKTSTIFAPLVIKKGATDTEVFKSKEFRSVVKIIWALRSHDDDIGIHLDHATSEELVIEAVGLGVRSVMFDASLDDDEVNIRRTSDLVRKLQPEGVWVEGE
ncbi:MAG: DEAD/DEAH box helicase family protein, partial [Verrucomicrobia bacterium]|nr:DEAD/DEAH box helicase family protein [Verrucomicrobiota bacterium]